MRVYLLFIMVILWGTSSSSQQKLELKLMPIIKNNKASFKYYIKNNLDKEVVINIASFGNESFFNLLVYKDKGESVDIWASKLNLRYHKIFETSKFYSKIKEKQKISKKYKTYGFNGISKIKLVNISLKPGKYKAVLKYSIEKKDLTIKKPLFKELWYGNMQSDTIKFEVLSQQ